MASMSEADKSRFKLETDLISLRSLVAVVEEGGFSAAAKRIQSHAGGGQSPNRKAGRSSELEALGALHTIHLFDAGW